jgi:hypothetical protein
MLDAIKMERIVLAGRIRSIALTAAVALGLVLWPAAAPPTIQAAAPAVQDMPASPGLGATLFESALTGPEVFAPGSCPTGAAGGENVGEGFKLSVRGRCVAGANAANLPVPGREITVWDGDLAIGFRVDAGAERAGINFYVRIRDSANLLSAYLNLAAGHIELFRRENGVNTVVASRQDLGDFMDPTDWNRLALRLRGGQVWLLINDEPVLHASDMPDYSGGIGLGLVREGNIDDQDEVAVVFRDLVLSGLEGPADVEPEAESDEPEAPATMPWPSSSKRTYSAIRLRDRRFSTICSVSPMGTRGSFLPWIIIIGAAMRSALWIGEIRSRTSRWCSSVPYSAPRCLRRHGPVFSMNVTKLAMP